MHSVTVLFSFYAPNIGLFRCPFTINVCLKKSLFHASRITSSQISWKIHRLEKDYEIENLYFHVNGFKKMGFSSNWNSMCNIVKPTLNTLHPTLWLREHFIPDSIHVREVTPGTNKFRNSKQRAKFPKVRST